MLFFFPTTHSCNPLRQDLLVELELIGKDRRDVDALGCIQDLDPDDLSFRGRVEVYPLRELYNTIRGFCAEFDIQGVHLFVVIYLHRILPLFRG